MNYIASEAENLAMWTMDSIKKEQNDLLPSDYIRNRMVSSLEK